MNIATRTKRTEAIPFLGSGMGYRRELKDQIFASRAEIDCLEIVSEQFIGDGRFDAELEEICDAFTVIPHGIGLSIGSERLDGDYLTQIKRLSDMTGSSYYSEHLATTRGPGIDIGHLSPLWFTEPMLEKTIANVHRVHDVLGKPLVLENVTYPFDIPGATMPQTEFFTRLVTSTGCGVLLDLTNVYINSVNHGFDPVAFIRAMPTDHIVQVHLAGGFCSDGMMIDSHSEIVEESTWSLLDELIKLIPLRASILEHDANFPESISVLLEQLARARKVMTEASPSPSSRTTQ